MTISYETLKAEATATITPLFDQLRRRKAALTIIEKRRATERENVDRTQQHIATLKETAAASLASDTNGYEKYKTALRKRTQELETLQEVVASFDGTVIPTARQAVDDARRKLEQAITALYVNKRPECEAAMSALLNQAVEKQDSFLSAFSQLSRDFGVSLNIGNRSCLRPVAAHPRLEAIARHLTRPPAMSFTAPPANAPQAALSPLDTPIDEPSDETPLAAPGHATPLDGEQDAPAVGDDAGVILPGDMVAAPVADGDAGQQNAPDTVEESGEAVPDGVSQAEWA